MVRAGVTGGHHKQKDTVRSWCSGIDGDVARRAIDELCTDVNAPLHEKGRGTITLTSIGEAKEFLVEHDDDDEFTWYVDWA